MDDGKNPRKRVYIETYGCAFNTSDSEVMAGLLARGGFEICQSAEAADAVILNSCTVKDRSYLNLCKRVRDLEPQSPGLAGPAVILAGCVPRVLQHAKQFENLSQIGPDNLTRVVEVVQKALDGQRVHATRRHEGSERLGLPRQRKNPILEIVPIAQGCLGSCTFCQTVIARGRLVSFPEEKILAQIETALDEGARIIWLTAQDCGAYGLDRGTRLPRLLGRIAALPGDFLVRVGMANPDLVKPYVEEFAEVLSHPRFFQFAHIPVQSGSDSVLRAMARPYSADDFEQICETLRARLPRITLATDVIAGFPGESEQDLEQTFELLRATRLSVINRSRFSARPGTRASRLPQLPSAVIAERSRRMSEFARQNSTQVAQSWVGWQGEVIIEQASPTAKTVARNFAYKPILLDGSFQPGQRVEVRVTGVEGFHLRAELVHPKATLLV